MAMAGCVVEVTWDAPDLEFFNVMNPRGTSFTIVPEPGAVTLLGLGLLGVAGWRNGAAAMT